MKPGLFKDTTQAGIYHLPAKHQLDLPRLVAKAHLILLAANLGDCKDKHQALGELGKACKFPAWYGVNFDALHDCLTDPDWQPKTGVVLQISGLDLLHERDPDSFSTLIEVLQSAASIRSAEKTPLWILLTSPTLGIADLPDA